METPGADAVAAVLQGIGYAEKEARDMLGPSASGRLTDLKVRVMMIMSRTDLGWLRLTYALRDRS